MVKYCSNCTHAGSYNERIEMDLIGSGKNGSDDVTLYQCPICDQIKATTTHENGLETTSVVTAEAVAAMKRPSGGLGLLLLGLAGIAIIAGNSSKK